MHRDFIVGNIFMICNIFHYLQPYHLPQNQPGALCFPEGVLFCPAALQIYLPMTSLLCSRFSAEWKSRELCDRFLKTGSFIFTLRVNYIFFVLHKGSEATLASLLSLKHANHPTFQGPHTLYSFQESSVLRHSHVLIPSFLFRFPHKSHFLRHCPHHPI